ncbi:MAG: UDP-N-acetylmuramoyl-tripeptide--D-alanyl-D-alanine ligase [Terriglobia bacterium]
MQLSILEIAAILGSPAISGKDQQSAGTARGYSIDSRSVQRGDLFFAIRGPRYDGHEFVAQALERGAVAAVVREGFEPPSPEVSSALIHVHDPAQALQQLARAVRQRWTGRLVGITGSTGKTTTKEMLAAVLEPKFRVLKSEGNLNNHLGVPLTLLRLTSETEVAVVEMGMSAPGEIASLAALAAPQTGVVTNVAPVHLEFFDSIGSIARAKRELIEHLQPPENAVLNHDDDRVRGFVEGFRGRVVTFGFTEGSDYRALRVRSSIAPGEENLSTDFEVQGPEHQGWFSISLAGRHNVENALAAIACGSLFGINPSESRAALRALRLPGKRMEILRLPGKITVINDSYNSNPLAMERMIETLASWPAAGQKIIVAGEMLELGPSSPEWHRHIGRECARAGVNWLIAVQGDAHYFLEGAREAGLPADRMAFFPAARDAGRYCLSIVRSGDAVLVKGSRGVKLEDAIDALGGSRNEPVWRDN